MRIGFQKCGLGFEHVAGMSVRILRFGKIEVFSELMMLSFGLVRPELSNRHECLFEVFPVKREL